jgi:hypothetical protein
MVEAGKLKIPTKESPVRNGSFSARFSGTGITQNTVIYLLPSLRDSWIFRSYKARCDL